MDFTLTPQQQDLRHQVRTLAQDKIAPIAAAVDESSRVSPELMRILSDAGLLRYTVPAEYGGHGITVTNLCIIREELAQVCGQADTNFIMQGLGSFPHHPRRHPRAEGALPALRRRRKRHRRLRPH